MVLGTWNPHLWVSQKWGYHFRGPHNKDYNIVGSILGSPYFEKLPFCYVFELSLMRALMRVLMKVNIIASIVIIVTVNILVIGSSKYMAANNFYPFLGIPPKHAGSSKLPCTYAELVKERISNRSLRAHCNKWSFLLGYHFLSEDVEAFSQLGLS